MHVSWVLLAAMRHNVKNPLNRKILRQIEQK
jgi:hypothetical protein